MLRTRSTLAIAIAAALAWTGCFVDLGDLQSGSSSSGMTTASGSGGGGVGGSGSGGTPAMTSTGGGGGASSNGGGGQAFNPPWWDQGYPRRFPIDVHDTGGDGLSTGLQVRYSGMLSQLATDAAGGGLRLVRYKASSHSWTEQAFVIDSTASIDNLWFMLVADVGPGADDTSYWFYSDKPNPPPPHGAPADVFPDLYVSFADGLSGFVGQNLPSISANGVTLASAQSVQSSTPFSPGHAVDFAMTATTDLGLGSAGWLGGGFQRTSDFDDSEPWLLWLNRTPGEIQDEAELNSVGESEMGATSIFGNAERIYGVERYSDHAIFDRDDDATAMLGPWPGGSFSSPLQVRFMNTDNTNQGVLVIRWARVRRCVDPPPDVSVGPVETLH